MPLFSVKHVAFPFKLVLAAEKRLPRSLVHHPSFCPATQCLHHYNLKQLQWKLQVENKTGLKLLVLQLRECIWFCM